jgi:hypothetical protein
MGTGWGFDKVRGAAGNHEVPEKGDWVVKYGGGINEWPPVELNSPSSIHGELP